MWRVIQLLRWLSPALRDILHGHVWEEDDQIVGFTNIKRRRTTDVWYISAVGVRPEYRRRGIARQLVSASLELIREHGGRIAVLDVIEGNYPAYKLYQNVGFEVYADTLTLELEPQAAPSPYPLPAGCIQQAVGLFEWRSRYDLARRITPEQIRIYEPVEKRRYQRPPITRLLIPLILKASGLKAESSIIRTPSTKVVAFGRSEARVQGKGRSEIHASLDPIYAELAPHLIQALLHRVVSLSPGRMVEMRLPEWQSALIDAAKKVGFEQRTRSHQMGILLAGG
jgi:predicted N-acetyltransferase YhbS